MDSRGENDTETSLRENSIPLPTLNRATMLPTMENSKFSAENLNET
jgi:hypothetical protein